MTYTRSQRLLALLSGITCHLAFASAVLTMMLRLYQGLQGGPTLPLALALPWDLFLLLQFPILHSLLLTDRGGRVLSHLVPLGIGRELRTTLYATIASLQLLLIFLAWAPLGPVWFRWHGLPLVLTTLLYAGGWILLAKSMTDAGLGIQMGYLGWLAVFRGTPPSYPPFRERGTLRVSRHPMYLAYTLLLWSGPVWSTDHLLIAVPWTLYCLLAPLHKEARHLRRHGESFRDYQRRVPYFLPRFPSSP